MPCQADFLFEKTTNPDCVIELHYAVYILGICVFGLARERMPSSQCSEVSASFIETSGSPFPVSRVFGRDSVQHATSFSVATSAGLGAFPVANPYDHSLVSRAAVIQVAYKYII
jgi:hypothetical protein